MNIHGPTSTIRKFIDNAATLWATVVFQGVIVGVSIIFIIQFFEPYIKLNFNEIINPNIPEWLYVGVGILLVMTFNLLIGKPMLRDNNREQIMLLEYVTKNIPDEDKIALFNKVGSKLANDFTFASRKDNSLTMENMKEQIKEHMEE